MELDKELKSEIIDLVEKGKNIPESYKNILFPPKDEPREIELKYGTKEREEDILADTMGMPFQVAKQFGKVKEGEWHNQLIFGDNLQALKHIKKLQDEGKMEKIKLVFIDPPFGTGDIYDAKGAPAYSAALQGAEYLEFLRKRLIFLKELIADDGSIYVRIDYHFGHYVKVLMDEIFDKNNFVNEIIVKRGKVRFGGLSKYNVATDSVYWYSMGQTYLFDKFQRKRYAYEATVTNMILEGERFPRERTFYDEKGKPVILLPPPNTHFKFVQPKVDKMTQQGDITLKKSRKGLESGFLKKEGDKWVKTEITPSYKLGEFRSIDTNWTDISGYSQDWGYPTENSEELLERVIKTSSNPGDIVLDCFAGSGTTGAVAEKLGRRWVMVDCGKLAMYTMIKRLHNLNEEIGNKGKNLKPKPFVLYNAGLYEDHSLIIKMGEENFKKFALELFQAEPKETEINGLNLDGTLLNCPVKVFSQKGYLTEEYIDQLHETLGDYLKSRMFIIAPASRVYFLEDYIERGGIRYYILRIPYSVIDELQKTSFTRPIQPSSLSEINMNIEQIGFDFIHPPSVKADYYRKKPRDKLIEEELIIEIKEFEAVQRSKEPKKFENPKDALSMVLLDRDYNGEYMNMTDYFFADEIKKNNYTIKIPATKLGNKIGIVYLDIFGNERVEVKPLKEFKKK